jgi:hypothetical protein
VDFESIIREVEGLKDSTGSCAAKLLELNEYVRSDSKKVSANFGNQTPGEQIRIALEDASQTLKAASAEITHFSTEADRMIGLLQR